MQGFSKKFNSILVETYHNMLLTEETKRKYSHAGLTFRDRNTVSFLMKFPDGRKISDVADYLKISRPSATVLVKKLEKHGLVERTIPPENERSTIVKCTRKGRLFSMYQQRYRQRLAEQISDGLTEEEKEALYKGFCKLNEFFVDSINESKKIHNKK